MPTPRGLRPAFSRLLPLALALALLAVAPLSISSRQNADSPTAPTPSANANVGELDIKLVNNSGGDLLFACRLFTDGQKLTLIGTGPRDAFPFRIRKGKRVEKPLPFWAHRIALADPELAQAFAEIIADFELCVDKETKIVEGGWITKIVCRKSRNGPALHSFCISHGLAYREVRKLEDLCQKLGNLYQDTLRRDSVAKADSIGTLRTDAQELAAKLRNRRAAYAELEVGYAEDAICPWEKITALTRFRPEMGELASQSPLVKQAHEILSSVFSAKSQDQLWGHDTPPASCLIRIGDVACRFGSYDDVPNSDDWGFDDIFNSLGFMYPPAGSPLRIAMLDVGTERLLLDFVFNEPAAYFRKTLALDHGTWTVRREYDGREIVLTPVQRQRLDYLTLRSGLFEFLFKGPIQDFAYIDISSLNIRDNQSAVAKIDFSIGSSRWVLPVNGSSNGWIVHKRWSACDYYAPWCYGRDTFRSDDELNAMDRGEFKSTPAK